MPKKKGTSGGGTSKKGSGDLRPGKNPKGGGGGVPGIRSRPPRPEGRRPGDRRAPVTRAFGPYFFFSLRSSYGAEYG